MKKFSYKFENGVKNMTGIIPVKQGADLVHLLSHLSPVNPAGQVHAYLEPVGGLDSSHVPLFRQGLGLQGVLVPWIKEKKNRLIG